WFVALVLGSSLGADAQDSVAASFNLLDDPAVEADQDKKKDQDVPTVVVEAGKLQDELPLGPFRRPAWTLHRVSCTASIYLQVDPGEVEFEQWLDIRLRKKRSQPDDRVRMSQELECGLGGRFQLDLYVNTIFSRNNGQNAGLTTRSWAAEIRYALADWGVIPGNPTFYLEYIMWNNGVDGHGDEATSSIEPKLLLGGEIARGWHWGANFFYEATFNASVREHGVTGSILYTIIDGKFSGGLSVKGVYESDNINADQSKTERSRELYIGPSFQIRM